MDAIVTKVKRNNRGTHPNSKAALLPPIVKGEVRNKKGKAPGTVDNRTAYLLGFNTRGAKDFDLGVKHRWLSDNQEATLRAIYKSLLNENGELVLLHSSDIEIRYETEVMGIPTTATARLSDVLSRLQSDTGITILHAQQTKDLLREAGKTASEFRQTLSDIADVLGIKKAPEQNIDFEREKVQVAVKSQMAYFSLAYFNVHKELPSDEKLLQTFINECKAKNVELTDIEISNYKRELELIHEKYEPVIAANFKLE